MTARQFAYGYLLWRRMPGEVGRIVEYIGTDASVESISALYGLDVSVVKACVALGAQYV